MFEPKFVLASFFSFAFFLLPVPLFSLCSVHSNVTHALVYVFQSPPLPFLPPMPKNKPLKMTGSLFLTFFSSSSHLSGIASYMDEFELVEPEPRPVFVSDRGLALRRLYAFHSCLSE